MCHYAFCMGNFSQISEFCYSVHLNLIINWCFLFCVWFSVIPLSCNILNCFLWKQTKNPVSLSCCHKMSWEAVSRSKMLWVLGSQLSWVVVLERRVLKAHHFTIQLMQYLLLNKFFFMLGLSPKQERLVTDLVIF